MLALSVRDEDLVKTASVRESVGKGSNGVEVHVMGSPGSPCAQLVDKLFAEKKRKHRRKMRYLQ